MQYNNLYISHFLLSIDNIIYVYIILNSHTTFLITNNKVIIIINIK